MKASTMLLILLTITTAVWSQGTTLYSIGEPTDEEQLYLEMINRARANPTAEGVRMATTTDTDVMYALKSHKVDLALMQSEFAAIQAGQPLALNAKLTTMARGHNADMFTHAFQGHESFNGDHLAERVAAVNYSFSSLGENVFSYAVSVFHGHAGFQVDWGPPSAGGDPADDTDGMQEGRGHRTNIHGDYREVGIGVILGTNTVAENTVGPQLVTQNFGMPSASSAFVTGVAYYDLNGNNFYDLGEGIAGLTVNVEGSSFHAVTANSGGYTVPIPTSSTTRAVTFTGLGLNGGGDAVISGGKNVKVDFKPAFTPLALTGPTVVNNGGSASFSFPSIGGATSYEWQALKIRDVPDDGAENFDRVTATTTETYAPLSTTVKHSGAAAYHLVHPIRAASSEILTYDDSFQVQAGASLSFRSRLRQAWIDEHALVQVSVDNGISWVDVYSQAGETVSNPSLPGETSFQLRTISLSAFEGQQIKLRFNYRITAGSLIPGTDVNKVVLETVGWFIDEVQFDHVNSSSDAEVTEVADGQTNFDFVPTETGEYVLSVRPIISGRAWAYGPARKVYSVEANSFVIIPQSTSQMVKVGGLAEFGVITTQEANSFQWLKNNKPVKGAMSVPLKFNPVSLQDAGSYSVQAKLDSQTETSDAFLLGVVEDFEKSLVVQQGKAVKLSVVAAGVDLKYEWRLDDQPLVDDDSVSGGKTKTLQIKGIQASQSGTYSCEVKTGSSDGAVGATTYVSVFDQKPQVSQSQNMSDGIVGGAFSHIIVYDEAPEMMPISFSAKGLPSGVKINSKTGEITGRPTKPGIYKITVVAKNNFGSTEAEQTIEVKAFPENLAGNYVGWLGRHETLNQMLGGRLDLKISSQGSLSGSLLMGTQKLAFKGNLEIVADDSELPYAEIYIQPKGNPMPELLKLEFSVDTDSQELTGAQVTQGESGLDVVGWRQKWSAKGEPATPYLGLHTFGLRLPEPGPLINDAAIPQGWGFGSFSPSADGKVKLVGQTADGEKFTNASFLGPQGEVLIFQTLYKTPIKGSLLGVMTIDVGSEVDLEDTSDNNLSGTVTWTRPEDKQSKARVYKAGFGLVDTPVEEPLAIEVVGASFVSPTGSTGVILNMDAGARNARVDFDFGDIESASNNPDQEVNIAAKSKITSFDPSNNPAGLKLAANVKTALLTGGFKLEDDDLRTGMTKSVKRSVKAQGMLIRDGEDYLGVGYFLLPGLPTDETPVLTDILSGKMTLRENILLP